MSDLIQDLRFGVRQLWRAPGITAAALLCIGLGVGANSATFSFAHAIFLRASPAREPDRLIRIFGGWADGLRYGSFSRPDYLDLQDQNEVLEGLVAFAIAPFHLHAGDRPERIWGQTVSGNYFSALGIPPALGRGFRPEDDSAPGARPVAVIGWDLWQRRFGSNPGVIGQSVRLNGRSLTIIGVAPQGFQGMDVGIAADLWVPMAMNDDLFPGRPRLPERGQRWIGGIIGRLKPGVTLPQARSNIDAVMARLAERYPDTNKGLRAELCAESQASLHPAVRGGFVAFMTPMFAVAVLGSVLVLSPLIPALRAARADPAAILRIQ